MENNFFRLFFAIELDPTLRSYIEKTMKQLCEEKSAYDIKWTTLEKLHITLRFLGQVPVEKIEPCLQKVKEKIANITPFNLSVVSIIPFPPQHPRMVAMIVALTYELAQLYRAVDQGVTDAGCEPEVRAYLPHITLGRTHYISSKLTHKINNLALTYPLEQKVAGITLFRSDPVEGMNVYSVVERIDFVNSIIV